MADIFGRNPSPFAGAFAADASSLIFNEERMAGSVVQDLQVDYSQSVSPIFEIGSNNRYYVVGRTNGSMQFGRIVGPRVFNSALLQVLGNVCVGDPSKKTITLQLGNAGCSGGVVRGLIELVAEACVAQGVRYGVRADNMLINENVQIVFGQLSRQELAL